MFHRQQAQKSDKSNQAQQKQHKTSHTTAPQVNGTHPAALIQRAKLHPNSLSSDDVLRLQQTIGNRATTQLIAGRSGQRVQAKLTIGEPDNELERQADRVAAEVVKQIHAPVSQDAGQSQPVQRESVSEQEKELQKKPMLQLQSAKVGMTAAPFVEASIQQARGGGQSLADSIREPMEQAFGTDFSGVKVHTDTHADQLNQSIQARAFTTGQDVFFRQGEYNPGSRGGQELIAHELTHVVQQNGGAVQRSQRTRTTEGKKDQEEKVQLGKEGSKTQVIQRAGMEVIISHQDEGNGTRVYVKNKNNPEETLGSIKIEMPAQGEVQLHTNAAQGAGGQGLGGSLYEQAFDYIFNKNLIPTGHNIVLTIVGGAMLHMQTRKLSERFGDVEIYKTAEEAREARKKAAKGQQGQAIDLDRFQTVFIHEHIKYLESLAEEYKKGELKGLRIKSIPVIQKLFTYTPIRENEDSVAKLLKLNGDILAGLTLEDKMLRDLVKDEYIREVTSENFNGVVFEMTQEFMKKFVGYGWTNKTLWLARKVKLGL